MKQALSTISLAAVILAPQAAQAKNALTIDFINGFETGIFVRDDDNAFYDYSCDKPKSDSNLTK